MADIKFSPEEEGISLGGGEITNSTNDGLETG